MQINGYNNINSFKRTESKSIGGVTLPKFGEFGFNTKSKRSMTEERYKQAIINQAKEDVKNGTSQSSPKYKKLISNYVSSASPDRKGIITAGLKSIANKPPTENLSMIDLLFGEIKYNKTYNTTTYAEFYDDNGELIANYSNGEWKFYETKAENEKRGEFLSIYNSAHKEFRENGIKE